MQLADTGNVADLFILLITKMSCSLLSQKQEINIRSGSLASQIYQSETITENYNCSYSLNEEFRAKFSEDSRLHIVGTSNDDAPRIIEIPECRFFVATLFQPQLRQGESFPHPLVVSFLNSLKSTGEK